MKEVYGDLIKLALNGEFEVITHGCNCFCTMGAGIAVPMKNTFGCDKFSMESPRSRGNINKLGCIDYQECILDEGLVFKDQDEVPRKYKNPKKIIVINSYTQYRYGRNHADGDSKPVDYEAITLCMRKINKTFPGKHIGLPMIGAGLAGGDWNKIKGIIEKELQNMEVTIVYYDNK